MSHPSSPAKPQGDDFVLWPEAPGAGPRVVNEAVIRRSLAGLAPEEWVADEETEAPSAVEAEARAAKEERFYPASRQWFRTTAALPAGDGVAKWWQEAPVAPPPSDRPPAVPEKPVSEGQGSAPAAGLLSPEEIWELAADELEQASRLGAPPAETATVSPLPPAPGAAPIQAPVAMPVPVAMAAPVPAPVPVSVPVPVPVSGPVVPTVPPPVEPLAAIPVSRAPISLRAEAGGLPLPTDRREGVPEAPAPLFEDLGAPSEAVLKFPQAKSLPAAPQAPAVAEDAAPEGEIRRRRERSERRRRSGPARRRLAWGRWLLGLIGLSIVLAGVAAMVGRDQLPPEWRESATRWWRKAHQLAFPHQYGYPKRGVQPRAGQAAEPAAPAAPAGAIQPEPAVTEGGQPPATTLSEKGAGASAPEALPGEGATSSDGPPAPPAGVVESPALSATPEGSVPMPVLRAEPVEEDPVMETNEAPAPAPPPDEGEGARETPGSEQPPADASQPAASASASPAAPTSPAADGGAQASPVTGGFTLWEGDSPTAVVAGPAAPEDPAAASPAAASPAAASPAAAETAGGEVAEGLRAVRQLIAARTVAEVLPCIFDATALETTVREYHARFPLQPLADAVVEHQYSGVIPATGRKAHIFNVLNPAHPRGFPVSAEQTPEGYRIDWQSYIQWRDNWLRRFLDSQSTEPQTLFVVLRRTHYFNDDVPKLDDKFAFKITSAVPDDEGAIAFVEKNSAIGRSLAELYEWRTLYFPVVEVQWVASGKESRYLRLNRIVRSSWRRVGE